MVVSKLLKWGFDNVISPTPQLDAAVLLCFILDEDRVYLVTHGDHEISDDIKERYEKLIEQRSKGKPIVYITGIQEFMSLRFEVNPAVLIPRSDTETLCEWVIERYRSKKVHIADLCCGSGCIGISLAKYLPDATVTMADISQAAIDVAKKNAQRHGVLERVRFVQADILSEAVYGEFDIVLSNPPYIESGVIDTLDVDVKNYEPKIALDGGTDGLMFYRRLVQIAPDMLKKGGMLAVEVGHTQADAVGEMMKNVFCDVAKIKDLSGIERVVGGICV